ncbi:dihydrofolate reductase family protein [Microbacterium sp.]|uniref:dihydrofolate reductase family protein n=1 Tax=Microbacterium sp. TaxID=51671 RepID=UPI0039E5143F
MSRVLFHTAVTLDGFLADPDDSLDWLFSVPGSVEAEADLTPFLDGVGAVVMGSTTYDWLWRHELRDAPERWPEFYAERPVFVFTGRELPRVPDADTLRFVSGEVSGLWPEIDAAAGDRDVWIVGGGDLVGQFADAGHLDQVRVSVAPVTLGAGRPLLPRRFGSERLTLESVRQSGQFAELTYSFR